MQWNDAKEGRKCLSRLGYIEDLVFLSAHKVHKELSSLRICTVRDDNWEYLHVSQLQLLHHLYGNEFVLWRTVKHHKDGWHAWVHLAIVVVVVHNVGEVEALAVKVGQLLHLKTPFLGYLLCKPLANEHDSFGKLQLLGHSHGEVIDNLQCLLHVA